MRWLALAFVFLLAGCGASTGTITSAEAVPATTSSLDHTPTMSTLLPSATATTPIELAAVFLAVVEEAVDGTDLAGFVDAEPESVLVIGQAFCELRDTGLTDEEVLTTYLEAVGSQQDLTEVDATFAGVVFGAAEATLCPTTE